MVSSVPEAVLTAACGLTDEVRTLLADATAADGVAPLSDGLLTAAESDPWAMSELRLDGELIGFGIAAEQGERGALEAVIAPDFRGHGHGQRLVSALIAAAGHPVWLWSHGDHPAAAAIAAGLGYSRSRELLQLQTGPVAELSLGSAQPPAGVRLRAFTPGDESGWLAVNNAAFDWHPEQGHQTIEEIRAITSGADFDPTSVIIAVQDPGGQTDPEGQPAAHGQTGAGGLTADGEQIIGFHQTKLTDDHPSGQRVGEVYVIATDPSVHARGIGRALTIAGMQHLIDAGAAFIELYVESDNAPARRLYERLGFDREIMHVSYAPPQEA